jgi:hypothetical protein
MKKKLSSLSELPAHIVTFRGLLARLITAGQAPLVLDAYILFLASLSPCSTSSILLHCLRWLTGQLDSRRSRPTQPTSWASTPTSSTFDSRYTNKLKEYFDVKIFPPKDFIGLDIVDRTGWHNNSFYEHIYTETERNIPDNRHPPHIDPRENGFSKT